MTRASQQRQEEQEGWPWSTRELGSKAAEVSQRLRRFFYRCENLQRHVQLTLFRMLAFLLRGAPFVHPARRTQCSRKTSAFLADRFAIGLVFCSLRTRCTFLMYEPYGHKSKRADFERLGTWSS